MKRYIARSRQSFTIRRKNRKGVFSLLLSLVLIGIFAYGLLIWLLPTLIGGLALLTRFRNHHSQNPILESVTLAPPVLNIPFEATNSAQIVIKGYATEHKKVELYIDDSLIKTIDTKEDGSFIIEKVSLSLGINNINGKTVDENGNKSLASKTIRLIYDNKKPKLEIKSPNEGEIIKGGDKKVKIDGITDSGLEVQVNKIKVIVDTDGRFSKTLDINEGENTLVISSTDTAGNSTTLTRKVIYQNQ